MAALKCLVYLISCLIYLGVVHAQTPTPTPDSDSPQSTTVSSTTTSAPSGITDSDAPVFESSYPPTITTCFLIQTFSGTLTAEGFPASSDLPPYAECWEIIRTGTAIEEKALFTLGPNGLSTDFATETSSSSPSQSSSASTSTKSHTTVIAASVSAVGGLILVGLFVIWVRHRRRTATASRMASSRASAWVRRSGWVKDEKVNESDGIALQDQRLRNAFT